MGGIVRVGALAAAAALALGGAAVAQERCASQAGTANVLPSPTALEGATPYVFKTYRGGALRLHVFQPPQGKAPARGRPAIVVFYAGGWMGGVVSLSVPNAQHLASLGAVAIVADYRTWCRNGADVGEEVADAKDAIRWVRAHAGALGVDPTHIAAFGGSSGGHLAMSAAVFDERGSRPDLLVLFYPCLDLTSPFEQASAKAIGRHGRDLSPLYHIRAGLPPLYLFEGTKDPLLPENRQFCDQTRAAGNACHWTQYEGAGHGFFFPLAKPLSPWFEPARQAMDEALAAEGYLPAKS